MLRDIRVESHCEHHLAPFLGVAHVAYLPNGRILGISKIARVVEIFARRLQTQETLTAQIADAIETALQPRGVAVLIEAEHQCMSMRGVRQPGVKTITTRFTGALESDASYRDRFLQMVHGPAQLTAPPSVTQRLRPEAPPWLPVPPLFAPRGTPDEVERGLRFQPKFDADGPDPGHRHRCGLGRGADVRLDERRGARAHAGDAASAISGAARAAGCGRRARTAATCCASPRCAPTATRTSLWLKVSVEGDGVACHTGARSCFYRSLPLGAAAPRRDAAPSSALNPFLALCCRARWPARGTMRCRPGTLSLRRSLTRLRRASLNASALCVEGGVSRGSGTVLR